MKMLPVMQFDWRFLLSCLTSCFLIGSCLLLSFLCIGVGHWEDCYSVTSIICNAPFCGVCAVPLGASLQLLVTAVGTDHPSSFASSLAFRLDSNPYMRPIDHIARVMAIARGSSSVKHRIDTDLRPYCEYRHQSSIIEARACVADTRTAEGLVNNILVMQSLRAIFDTYQIKLLVSALLNPGFTCAFNDNSPVEQNLQK